MIKNNRTNKKDDASIAKMKSSLIINEIIGDNLRLHREARNLSQEDLADALGISVFRLRRYELARIATPCDVFYRACEFLNVSSDEMLSTREDNRNDLNNLILRVGLQKSEEISLYLSSNFPDLEPDQRETVFSMILAHYIATEPLLKRLTGVLLRVYKKLYAYYKNYEKYSKNQA